ncbi:MAG: class A beta-lactamase [Pyrinomonadaceae bacterium]
MLCAPQTSQSSIQPERVEPTKPSSGGMGFTAIHIESGRCISVKASERFPMASAYKFPIAVHLLMLVDEGKVELDHLIRLEPKDVRPGGVPLTDNFEFGESSVSVRDFLEMMLTVSDNTASDLILRLAGGPQAVTACMRALGIEDMSIDRSTIEHVFDMFGLPLPPESEWGPGRYVSLLTSVPADKQRAAAEQYARDSRDTSTPDAMVSLLAQVYRKNLLKPETAKLLFGVMRSCQTGDARLKGLLPAGTEVAHKSGTAMGIINDVGIITLPNGAGHIAIAVFVKGSKSSAAESEHLIAEVARRAYDHFLSGALA